VRKVVVLAILLFVVLGAQYMTWQQHSPITVTNETIAGNPVNHYAVPAGAAKGVVIVAHGFAANKEMMSPWGYYLAYAGFDAYVFDEPGHGQSNRPLPVWTGAGNDVLGNNLRAMIDELVTQHRAEPGRIALVGHSMGGAAVTAAALADSRVKATVAVSSAYSQPVPAGKPSDFLSLAAERDPAYMVKAVTALAAQSAGGQGELGKQYGSFADGTARASSVIPGRNHITILYDETVMVQTTQWIGAALGVDVQPDGATPWLWVFVALGGAAGVVMAIASILAPATRVRESRSFKPVSLLTGIVTLAVAAFSAVLACVYVRTPWAGLAVVDYLLPYFLVMAAVLLVIRMLWPRDFNFQLGSGVETALGDVIRAVGVFLGYIGAVGTVLHMDLSNYMLNTQRILPFVIMAVALWLYFVQEAGLKRAVEAGHGPWGSALTGIVSKLIIAGTWLGASALPNPQPVLSLTVPVVMVFMVLLELFSVLLTRLRYSTVAVSTFAALVLAWSLAASFPLT
jgi:pimeloyl-ACP methyl ester carboxylesterase